ncbi:MAG: sodium-translocating pyrophosphatase [Deltaproteobacteria bacterium]|nr:sodium-translocating pyrophosphatase [Deltaproteobacteria bacterium]
MLGSQIPLLLGTITTALIALFFASVMIQRIKRADAGTSRMQEVGQAIREGAMAFIRQEYTMLAIFVVSVAILLAIAQAGALRLVGVAFIVGACCSALAGFIGMRAATIANVRTASAARCGLNPALEIAFAGGSVMGMSVVGLGLLGLTLVFWFFSHCYGTDVTAMKTIVLPIISGFSFGASSIALFARVGGGIYTKAADVGGDLVGKVEKNIPEDDPRNPATIADNVGDNVGDVCGMGADLFESYVGAIVSAMILGVSAGFVGVILPLLIAGMGILCSVFGTFFVRTREGGNPQQALNRGSILAGLLFIAGSYAVVRATASGGMLLDDQVIGFGGIWGSIVTGLLVGIAIGLITEHFCAKGKAPVNAIVASTVTGPATDIIAGLAVGMRSTTWPLVLIAVAIVCSFNLAGLYGIALAGLGMLATLGIQLAVDAYGPIADNAGGIVQMSGLGDEVRARTDNLDAVGNTTAAIGKGFAIGSAALTALALFAAFREQVGLSTIDVSRAEVMAGLLIGATLPFAFSAMAMRAVGQAADRMVEEVRRQFREIPGLMEGTARPEYKHCVAIATSAAMRQMVKPGLLAILAPLVVGFGSKLLYGDVAPLGGMLAGATASGVLLAIFMANAGGAWDNAKKQIEEEPKDAAKGTGKGSFRHAAAVIGDTVGDPFKDTAGPSLNILIKLMSVLALVLSPLFV